jgi:hypothetical protein
VTLTTALPMLCTPLSPWSLSLAVAKNRAPFLVYPDVAVARSPEGPVDVALESDLGDAGRDGQPRWLPVDQNASVS